MGAPKAYRVENRATGIYEGGDGSSRGASLLSSCCANRYIAITIKASNGELTKKDFVKERVFPDGMSHIWIRGLAGRLRNHPL